VPRARTYLAATTVRGLGWRTTYDLLSLSPPRERNMFTSGNSNSLLSSRGLSSSLRRTGHRGASCGVTSRRVTLPLSLGRTLKKKKRKKRDAAARARKTVASLTRETASASSSTLPSRISSHGPVTICPPLSLASSCSVRPSDGPSVLATGHTRRCVSSLDGASRVTDRR